MSKKTDIAKKVFHSNPKLKEVFVCENGNAFEAESRALAHAREREVKFLGGITRSELKDELLKEASLVVKKTKEGLDTAEAVIVGKEKALKEAQEAFEGEATKGKELDEAAKNAAKDVQEAEKVNKLAADKAKTTNTDADKKAAEKAKAELTKVMDAKAKADKSALEHNTVAINQAETMLDDAKKELTTAVKNKEAIITALTEAEAALAELVD